MKHLTSSCLPEPDDTAINNKWGCNYCSSELLESGIQFQIGSWEDHLLNITFSNGVISIPTDHRQDHDFSVQEPHCLRAIQSYLDTWSYIIRLSHEESHP
ncbi:unnamed protein product [Prunus armeniaca]|uniref:Uncharacterized protein n=1 Tax=Prunus armeniaca TaxID=36596 RepID=A0A6J5VA51_PRUAR|nr:unnamed protein product [Prunus armeniaca]